MGQREDPYWLPSSFFPDSIVALYDADEDAMQSMSVSAEFAASFLLPYCLGDHDGEGTLHVNFDPFTNSLLPTAPVDAQQYLFTDGMDYVFHKTLETQSIRKIRVRPLDALQEIRDGTVPPPDVLILDTQGTELDVLRGARKALGETTVALYVEVEFTELYSGQALFGEVAAFLNDLDFDFIAFTRGTPASRHRLPLGQRAGGALFGTDAVWLKRISSIANDPERLMKLAFFATCFHQPGVAIPALLRLRAIGAALPADRRYGRFLRDLTAAVDRMPEIYPPRFDELVSARGSAGRFTHQRNELEAADFERYVAPLRDRLMKRESDLAVLLNEADTPVEQVLRTNEFAMLTDLIKRTRLEQTAELLRHLRIGFQRT